VFKLFFLPPFVAGNSSPDGLAASEIMNLSSPALGNLEISA
jgi:hypothetical protein